MAKRRENYERGGITRTPPWQAATRMGATAVVGTEVDAVAEVEEVEAVWPFLCLLPPSLLPLLFFSLPSLWQGEGGGGKGEGWQKRWRKRRRRGGGLTISWI